MRMCLLVTTVLLGVAACHPAPPIRPPQPELTEANAPPESPRIIAKEAVGGSDVAPGGEVEATDGTTVELANLWKDQQVVLVFYRGHWCPPCQVQLSELNKHFGDFQQKHTAVVAVSVDPVEDSKKMVTKLGLRFPLYSDPQMQVIAKFGVGDYTNNLSKPATFVIQPGGTISWKRVGDDMSQRPSIDDVLAALK